MRLVRSLSPLRQSVVPECSPISANSSRCVAIGFVVYDSLAAPRTPGVTKPAPRVLVIVPTRELATQVAAVIEPLAAAYGMKTATVFGGVTHAAQRKAFATGVEIVVACPGRLLDHMQAGDVSLDRIEVCVLDEADHMAEFGHDL